MSSWACSCPCSFCWLLPAGFFWDRLWVPCYFPTLIAAVTAASLNPTVSAMALVFNPLFFRWIIRSLIVWVTLFVVSVVVFSSVMVSPYGLTYSQMDVSVVSNPVSSIACTSIFQTPLPIVLSLFLPPHCTFV